MRRPTRPTATTSTNSGPPSEAWKSNSSRRSPTIAGASSTPLPYQQRLRPRHDPPRYHHRAPPEIDAAFAQTRTWHDDQKSLALLSLYQQRIKNKETKTTTLLRQLQQERREALKQAVEEAALLSQLAASKGETFDIARDLPRCTSYPQFDFSAPELARLILHAQRLAEARKLFQKPQKPLRCMAA